MLGIIGHSGTVAGNYFTSESSTDANGIYYGSGTGKPRVYSDNSTKFILATDATQVLTQPRAFCCVYFGTGVTASKLYAESQAPVSGDLGSHTLGNAAMTIGSYYTGASESYGINKMAEVYAYSRELTLREARTLRRYRDSYYGAIQ